MIPKLRRLCTVAVLLCSWPMGILAQQQQSIEQAYREGRLSLDQKILYQFYAGEHPAAVPAAYRREETTPIKCGTPALMAFHQQRSRLSPSTVAQMQAMLEDVRQQAIQTYRSPSGRFQINYTTTGDNAVPPQDDNANGVPDYVEWTAQAADSSYRHEVLTLGYSDPVPNPANPYQIYFEDINFYGYTTTNNGTTYIVIHNNFEGFPANNDPQSDQRGAIRVTIAHELKHAIQYAATQWQGETDLWTEMDATLMEEVVYDVVNDYYNYLADEASIFVSPTESFYPGSYYHVTWALYFQEKYGPKFWPSVWDIIKQTPSITMVEVLSQQLGSREQFYRNYIESQLWHFAAGPNQSAEEFGFEERRSYPHPTIASGRSFYTTDLTTPVAAPEYFLDGFSATYYTIDPPAEARGTVTIDISVPLSERTGVGALAYFSDGSTAHKIISSTDNETVTLKTDWSWNRISSLGLITTNSDTGEVRQTAALRVGSSNGAQLALVQNYPNPFRQQTTIRFSLAEASHVTLSIFDVTGRKVRTLYDQQLEAGLYSKSFDAQGLASGMYIYQLTTNRQAVAKKMMLIK